ncbi:MAG: hypothetical protein ACOX83_10700 [Candidatus Spyradocola sp.]
MHPRPAEPARGAEHSKLGEGSTFTVRIPIQRPKRAAAADAALPEA